MTNTTAFVDCDVVNACARCGGPTFKESISWLARHNAKIGELKALCVRCACTHKLVIVRKESSPFPAHIEEPWYQPPKWDVPTGPRDPMPGEAPTITCF